MAEALRLAWLVPDDKGGGVLSVAQACCRRAVARGRDATLLLALDPEGSHADEFGGFRLASLSSRAPHTDIPALLARWLENHRPDALFLNSCEQADSAIPYIPSSIHLVCVVHDTAERYFEAVLRYEDEIDAIVAVSETVASRFRARLRNPSKLQVILNGTVFPDDVTPIPSEARDDDLVFLGGDQPAKGAHDVLALWEALQARGFPGKLHWFGQVDASFLARIDRARARERIVVHGRVARMEIFRAAAQSKVLLMLSRVEPFGMATIECAGMGCLAAAWDIPTGTREIVDEGGGTFAPLGDHEALAAGVMRLMHEHASKWEAAMRRVRATFSEVAMWDRYEAALAGVLAAPVVQRSLAGQVPPPYRPPVRLFQRLPAPLRSAIRSFVGRWPRVGFALRDFRGR